MILKKSQEMGSDAAPNNTLSDAISRLSTVTGTEHSVWRFFGDTSEMIDAIISEIGETVLARRLLFVGKETGAKLEIIASNRHLIEVLPPPPFTETDCIEAVLDCLYETFFGCNTLKTQISERNPKLPETNHSFSLKMLRDTFEERKEASFFAPTLNSVAGEIRNMASAWLEAEANGGTLLDSSGPKEQTEFLEQKMNHLMVTVDQNSFRNFEAANLTLLPVDEVTMLALLQTQKKNALGALSNRRKTQLNRRLVQVFDYRFLADFTQLFCRAFELKNNRQARAQPMLPKLVPLSRRERFHRQRFAQNKISLPSFVTTKETPKFPQRLLHLSFAMPVPPLPCQAAHVRYLCGN